MPVLSYGSFEEVLRAHIVPEIIRLDLGNLLLLSPAFDRDETGVIVDMRSAYLLDSTDVTRICSGERPLPPALRAYYSKPEAIGYVKGTFREEIIPRILDSDRETLRKDILHLTQSDDSLPEEAKSYLANLSTLEDFLTEVYLRAIHRREETRQAAMNLPAQNRFFHGREELLALIRERFLAGVHTQGLFGMGGVGKTQIALRYAHTYADSYEAIWWVSAENKAALQRSAAAFLAAQGCLPKGKNPEQVRAAFLKDFKKHSGWLLIYDNAEYGTPEEYEMLSEYFPPEPAGDILLTTRCRDAFENARHMEISVFGEEEAAAFLQRRSHLDDGINAARVAQQLGYLPLALEYAAAYIKETPGVDFESYSRKLERYGVRVLDRRVGRQAYKNTVRQAFHITLDKILEDAGTNPVSQGAQQFLSMCAFLAPEGIELDVFVNYGQGLPEPIRSVLSDELDRDELLRSLTKYSLVQMDMGAMSIHRLLQEVLRDELEPDAGTYWINCVYGVFYSIFYSQRGLSVEELQPILSTSVPHVQSILRRYVQQNSGGGEALPDGVMAAKEYFSWTALLIADAKQLEGQALIDAHRRNAGVFQAAIDFYDTIPGEKTSYLAYTLMLLAQAYERLGEPSDALGAYKRALSVLGEVVEGLPEELTPAQTGTLLALYRAEAFRLAADICAAVGSSGLIYRDTELLWGNLRCLVQIVQKTMRCYPRPVDAGSYLEAAMFLKIFSVQVADCTRRAFILRVHAPESWREARGGQPQEGPFGFFCPSAAAESAPPEKVTEGFDILLERDSGSDLAWKLDGLWRTLAFSQDVQTESDMLRALMDIDRLELGISGRRSLYAAICTLAGHLGREDIVVQYGSKLTMLP